MKRAHLQFFGDIEGTGYRFFIKQKAIELGLKGFCRLNPSNHLEVEVEGTVESVDAFLKFVEKGVSIQAETNQFELEIFHDLKGYKTMVSDIV